MGVCFKIGERSFVMDISTVNANVSDLEDAIHWTQISGEEAHNRYLEIHNQAQNLVYECEEDLNEAKKAKIEVDNQVEVKQDEYNELSKEISDTDWEASGYDREGKPEAAASARATAESLRKMREQVEEALHELKEMQRAAWDDLTGSKQRLEDARSRFCYVEGELQRECNEFRERLQAQQREMVRNRNMIMDKGR